MEAWQLAVSFLGSFVAGYIGAAVGLVLGTLRLPLILLAAGNPAAAAGTNIAISAAAAASGGLRHAREGRVDWRVVAWMAPPSAAGAVAGALLASDAPERLLYALIAAVLAWNAVDLAFRPVRPRASARPRVGFAAVSGALIGLLGGAIGVILGTLRMPALVRAVGLDIRRAAGTNLVVGFLLGVAAFAAYAGRLEIQWGVLAAGLAGALPGGWLGAKVTGRAPEELLRRGLAVLLAAIAVAFAAQAALS
ncbi:MAG: sulfite exporter TauE/SafE family protein [Actinobacteria bacterium]|nr:sulfite exporter TauE/SafE family protein [Actinomycetota bacterium]